MLTLIFVAKLCKLAIMQRTLYWLVIKSLLTRVIRQMAPIWPKVNSIGSVRARRIPLFLVFWYKKTSMKPDINCWSLLTYCRPYIFEEHGVDIVIYFVKDISSVMKFMWPNSTMPYVCGDICNTCLMVWWTELHLWLSWARLIAFYCVRGAWHIHLFFLISVIL